MKKLWLVLALLLIGTFAFAEGQLRTPWNIPIVTDQWTAVTASHSAVKFQVRTRNGNNFQISSASNATVEYYTVAGTSLPSASGDSITASDATVTFELNVVRDNIVFYAKSIDRDDILEILVLR